MITTGGIWLVGNRKVNREERIVFSAPTPHGGYDLLSVRVDGSDLRNVFGHEASKIAGLAKDYDIDISPDGNYLCFPIEEGIAVVSLFEKRMVLKIHIEGVEISFPRWSPNGLAIAYAACKKGTSGCIEVVGVDGTGRRVVSHPDTGMGIPSWSPDGKRIARDLGMSYTWGIGIIDVLTGVEELILGPGMGKFSAATCDEFYGKPCNPKWSPSGTRILFEGSIFIHGEEKTGVFTMLPDGSECHLLVEGDKFCGFCWSPDGSGIAYCDDGLNMYVASVFGNSVMGKKMIFHGAINPSWVKNLYIG